MKCPVFVNPMFRCLAGQYPYKVKRKTIYVTRDTDFIKLFEETLEATVWILRSSDKDHKLLDTIFIPDAVDGDPYKREVRWEPDINKRLDW